MLIVYVCSLTDKCGQAGRFDVVLAEALDRISRDNRPTPGAAELRSLATQKSEQILGPQGH
jgi:hypothetical protein